MTDMNDTTTPAEVISAEGIVDEQGHGLQWSGTVDFAERLTRLFEETRRVDGKRWTLQHVADECVARGQNVTKQYILFLKSGQRGEPRLNLVEALADVFRVPVSYFTADASGRMSYALLPVLVAINDPHVKELLYRPHLVEEAGALADPDVSAFLARVPLADVLRALGDYRAQSMIETVMNDPMTVRAVPR